MVAGDECRESSDCNIHKGLCCRLTRRQRMQPKKVNILREIRLPNKQQEFSCTLIIRPWSWLLFQLCTYFTDADVCIGHVASNQVVTVRRRYNLLMKWDLKRKYLGRFKWEPFKFLFCESFSSFSSFHEPQDNFEWPSKSFKIFHSTGGASRFFALFIFFRRKFNVQLSNWTFHFHHIHN